MPFLPGLRFGGILRFPTQVYFLFDRCDLGIKTSLVYTLLPSFSIPKTPFKMTDTDAGIGKVAPKSLPTSFTIACFIAVALYNVAELFFIIFATFKKRRGLYFWSFLVSTCGIGLYSIGFLLKDLSLSSQSVFFVTLIVVGWSSMVTGQSVVLYSRLHLVLRDPRKLRLVLIVSLNLSEYCGTFTSFRVQYLQRVRQLHYTHKNV
jgi:hypothetical protein